jgi:hypothetical protein
MMKLKLLISLCVFSVSGVAYANCPDSLNAEKMAECITIEGWEANYQDWLADFNNGGSSDTNVSTISPITGTDVRTIQPASGNNTTKAAYSSDQ